MLQALCATGAVNYSVAFPIIMGQNIGTCVTSIISSIGASKSAKRAAMVHLYFNLIGTIIFMTVFYSLSSFVEFTFLKESANAAGIAVVHSLFNIGTSVMLFPFANKLVKLAQFTIPEEKIEEEDNKKSNVISIDERFIDKPAFAMELCRGRVREMAEITKKAISLSLEVLMDYDKEKVKEVIRLESVVDRYEDVIGSYLVKISSRNISTTDSQSMSIMLHSMGDLERISDHAKDIVKAAKKINKKELEFTKTAKKEIKTLCKAVNDICNLTVESFCKDDRIAATHVEPLEEVIDTLSKKIKKNHIKRLRKGKCTIEMGFILEDVLTDLERISDHCSNVAIEMITIYDNDYNTHEYFRNFSKEERDSFNEEYEVLLKDYPI